ncbi:hypothetical protein J3458_001616 [Metarhizium acridum]|uniref:uncharacterized protein n=1 Tax=Metarhizium acridum TaxID=92637 RepID=UPI001C6D0915|nr:hypothetical protein J3458_001616 [Metarhizium acridum]
MLAFKNCPSAYIIIDGLDDCVREQRKHITQWFRKLVEDLPSDNPDILQCLFVSQDDDIARKYFSGLASIKIGPEDNKGDIDVYSRIQAAEVQPKLQLSDQKASEVSRIVANSTSASGWEEELEEHIFPTEINDAYRRIMHRIKMQESRAGLRDALMLLGWLVCAKRPLRWQEVQGLKSITRDKLSVEHERQRFVVAPKDLCESLVEVRADGTLELVPDCEVVSLADTSEEASANSVRTAF